MSSYEVSHVYIAEIALPSSPLSRPLNVPNEAEQPELEWRFVLVPIGCLFVSIGNPECDQF
jgi:hypothetical protein